MNALSQEGWASCQYTTLSYLATPPSNNFKPPQAERWRNSSFSSAITAWICRVDSPYYTLTRSWLRVLHTHETQTIPAEHHAISQHSKPSPSPFRYSRSVEQPALSTAGWPTSPRLSLASSLAQSTSPTEAGSRCRRKPSFRASLWQWLRLRSSASASQDGWSGFPGTMAFLWLAGVSEPLLP
jgi:hypothetical protein